MCSPNSFYLPNLSSDFRIRQLPKLAPLFSVCYGIFAEKLSPTCLCYTQSFLAIMSLALNVALDLQKPQEGTSSHRRHQLWGYMGMPHAQKLPHTFLFPLWFWHHPGSTGVLVALVLLLLCPPLPISPSPIYHSSWVFPCVPLALVSFLQCPLSLCLSAQYPSTLPMSLSFSPSPFLYQIFIEYPEPQASGWFWGHTGSEQFEEAKTTRDTST